MTRRDHEYLKRHRDEYREHGGLSPETKLLDAIFGYGVSRNGELYEDRYDYSTFPARFLFRRWIGQVT